MRFDRPLDDVFRGRSHVRVLRALDELPPGLSVSAREVARRAGVSHPTASSILASFLDQGLVHVRRVPRLDLFELSPDHVLVEKIHAWFGWERGLRDELVKFLRDQMERHVASARVAFLFGSAARGEMTTTSDIDVAVIAAEQEASQVDRQMEQVVEAVRARFGNRLNVVLGTSPVDELRAPGRPAHRLWAQIAEQGVPIIGREDRTTMPRAGKTTAVPRTEARLYLAKAGQFLEEARSASQHRRTTLAC